MKIVINIGDRIINFIRRFFAWKNIIFGIAILFFLFGLYIFSESITISNTFEPGKIIKAEEINENFKILENKVNELDGMITLLLAGNMTPSYDSGWFLVETTSNYQLTHGLDTNLLHIQVLFQDPNGLVWDASQQLTYRISGSEPVYAGYCLLLKDMNTFDFATANQAVFAADNTLTYGENQGEAEWTYGNYRVFAWKISTE